MEEQINPVQNQLPQEPQQLQNQLPQEQNLPQVPLDNTSGNQNSFRIWLKIPLIIIASIGFFYFVAVFISASGEDSIPIAFVFVTLFAVLVFLAIHSIKKPTNEIKAPSKKIKYIWLLIIVVSLFVTYFGPLYFLFLLIFLSSSVSTGSGSLGFGLYGYFFITVFFGSSLFPYAVSNYLKTQSKIQNSGKATALIVVAYFLISVLIWVGIITVSNLNASKLSEKYFLPPDFKPARVTYIPEGLVLIESGSLDLNNKPTARYYDYYVCSGRKRLWVYQSIYPRQPRTRASFTVPEFIEASETSVLNNFALFEYAKLINRYTLYAYRNSMLVDVSADAECFGDNDPQTEMKKIVESMQ